MRILLVGNANVFISAKLAAWADRVVQINDCVNDRPALARKTTQVFLLNTGHKHHERMAALAAGFAARGTFPQASFVLPRNPAFYAEIRRALQAAGHPNEAAFAASLAPDRLPPGVPVVEISYEDSARLRESLLAQGMEPHQDASTGLIAYDWIRRRMEPGDELRVIGFGHEGWRGHPWAIERRIMAADLVETSPLLRRFMPRGLWRRGLILAARLQRLAGA